MTTIGASTPVSTSMLLTQEQTQQTQNPPAKNLPQNQEESLTNRVASVLYALGCFAAFQSGIRMSSHEAGIRMPSHEEGLVRSRIYRYDTDAFYLAGISIALSTLGFIVSKTPKMIDATKNFIFSNENPPVPTKSREEKTFPIIALLVSGLAIPSILHIGYSTVELSFAVGHYLRGTCTQLAIAPYYNRGEPVWVDVCDRTFKNILPTTDTLIVVIGGFIMTRIIDNIPSFKSKVEKVDQSANVQSRDVQGPEAMPNNQ